MSLSLVLQVIRAVPLVSLAQMVDHTNAVLLEVGKLATPNRDAGCIATMSFTFALVQTQILTACTTEEPFSPWRVVKASWKLSHL